MQYNKLNILIIPSALYVFLLITFPRTTYTQNTSSSKVLSSTIDTCTLSKNCTECYASSSYCHWCAHSQSCHSRTSFSGCIYGTSCNSPSPTPSPHPHDANDTKCQSHKNCTECYASSYTCHWCSFDNSCHAKGSMYGCTIGTDCYSNTQCMRLEPEYYYEEVNAQGMPDGYFVILSVFLSSVFCCCTVCFCFVKYSKGAYDDMMDLIGENNSMAEAAKIENEQLMQVALLPPSSTNIRRDSSNSLSSSDSTQSEQATPSSFEIQQKLKLQQHTKKHASYLYQSIKLVYILSITTISLLFFTTTYYYPTLPSYNFCNNQLDWHGIISSLTSFKVEADFQMLFSVYNPNHYNIKVTHGMGTFSFEKEPVGTFYIPNASMARAQSISDYLVNTRFTPDKWQAVQIVADYYKGNLELVVDLELYVTVPALLGEYELKVGMNDYIVRLDDMNDRHLCACQSWNQSHLIN